MHARPGPRPGLRKANSPKSPTTTLQSLPRVPSLPSIGSGTIQGGQSYHTPTEVVPSPKPTQKKTTSLNWAAQRKAAMKGSKPFTRIRPNSGKHVRRNILGLPKTAPRSSSRTGSSPKSAITPSKNEQNHFGILLPANDNYEHKSYCNGTCNNECNPTAQKLSKGPVLSKYGQHKQRQPKGFERLEMFPKSNELNHSNSNNSLIHPPAGKPKKNCRPLRKPKKITQPANMFDDILGTHKTPVLSKEDRDLVDHVDVGHFDFEKKHTQDFRMSVESNNSDSSSESSEDNSNTSRKPRPPTSPKKYTNKSSLNLTSGSLSSTSITVDSLSTSSTAHNSLVSPSPDSSKCSFLDVHSAMVQAKRMKRIGRLAKAEAQEEADDSESNSSYDERSSAVLPDTGLKFAEISKTKVKMRKKAGVIRDPEEAIKERRERRKAIKAQYEDERMSGNVVLKPKLKDFVDIHLMRGGSGDSSTREASLETKVAVNASLVDVAQMALQLSKGEDNESDAPARVEEMRKNLGGKNGSAQTDGGVWTWGLGRNGELGTGQLAEMHKSISIAVLPEAQERATASFNEARDRYVEVPTCVTSLTREVITEVACGSLHTVVRSLRGRVFTWGSNQCGQLGLGDRDDRYVPFCPDSVRQSPFFQKKAAHVAAGGRATGLLTPDDTVFMCGKFVHTAQGDEANDQVFLEVSEIPMSVTAMEGKKIAKLAVGGDHYAALTHSGDLYMWGMNHHGQLGFGDTVDCVRPTPIKGDRYGSRREFWADVCCGPTHTIARGFNHKLYAWGNNKDGQLGAPSENNSLSEPTLVTQLEHVGILDMFVSQTRSVVLADDGTVYRTHVLDKKGPRFERLPSRERVVHVGVDEQKTFAIGVKGGLMTWAHTTKQVRYENYTSFKGSNVQALACGRNHHVVIASLPEARSETDDAQNMMLMESAYKATKERSGLASAAKTTKRMTDAFNAFRKGKVPNAPVVDPDLHALKATPSLNHIRAKTRRRSLFMGRKH